MNKLLRNVLISVIGTILLLVGIYLGLSFYYKKVFPMNTWINGIYCTGKTVEEVNKELLQDAEAPFLTIRDLSGEEYQISPEEMGFTLEYTDRLKEILSGTRNSFYWPRYLVESGMETVFPIIQYDENAFKDAVSTLEFVQWESANPGELKIVPADNGYVLHDTMKNRLNEEKMYEHLTMMLKDEDFMQAALESGSMSVNLRESQCYEDISPDENQQQVLLHWKNLKPYIDSGIIYDMGDEQIALKGKIASSFIALDDSGELCFDSAGQPVFDESVMEDFIHSLADAYNTYGKELTFTTTAGETKVIPYVTYGTELNVKEEIAYLKTAFSEKRTETHIPAYSKEGYVRGKNDIGDTYIEIDMGNQKLYAYKDGECIVNTDVVTGNMKKKWSTPEGVVYVYAKQRNRTLRGPGYASFVKYWMPVKGGVGLHDASWRNKFGGEIYKTDGSHGCINIPRSVMSDIYESFEIGTPVIMFY